MEAHINQENKKKRAEINEIYAQEIQKNPTVYKTKILRRGGKSTKLLAYKLKKTAGKKQYLQNKGPTYKINSGQNRENPKVL